MSEVDEPSDGLLDPLVDSFGKSGDILGTVETILRSNVFYSPAAYRCRVKSPVEYAVGLVRAFEGQVGTDQLSDRVADLGQSLYNPPTSAGWPDGLHWLNDATIVGRENLARDLLQPPKNSKYRLDAAGFAQKHSKTDVDAAKAFFVELLLQSDIASQIGETKNIEEAA